VPLFFTICSRPSLLHLSSFSARQIKPLAWVAIKLIASGLTFSAAKIRSPSFSLSSSSIKTTIFPSEMSEIISCMLFNSIFNI
jgi:hypothetical protein